MILSQEEQRLKSKLLEQPADFDYRYTHAADCELRQELFRSLACHRQDYLHLFFPNGTPADRSKPWSLREAQGAVDGAEYTPAAKGTACGHIFKNGESTYHCKTCAADDTCVLCAKCFESSHHEGHMVLISVSPGNSGCCDCGDKEAWRREVRCSIHTADADEDAQGGRASGKDKQKGPVGSQLPDDLVRAIRMTISICIDYLCDIFSCSPEQLRLPKSQTSILTDEREARLSQVYGDEPPDPNPEFNLVLWNDEKHTVDDVEKQVARACSRSKRFGLQIATEVNDTGRCVVIFSRDLDELLHMAEVLEQLKLTVTIRAARDTFREQMCATIIDWISDIAGCAVGNEPYLLRNIVCEELLKPWRSGSLASNMEIGQAGIDDHELEDRRPLQRRSRSFFHPPRPPTGATAGVAINVQEVDGRQDPGDDDDDDEDEEDYDDMDIEDEDDDMAMEIEDLRSPVELAFARVNNGEMEVDIMDEAGDVDAREATIAGYPPPPPPPPVGAQRRRILTPQESEDGDADQARPISDPPYSNVPRTPKVIRSSKRSRPSKHWLEKPEDFRANRVSEPYEDLWQRVRLDFLILYDLRLWKTLRIHLRHLYITTVVTIPHFKRVLGLRFAGLYTALAQLYLIADREPDHSIINLSVQMLTTPTITQEVVERGNFLTNLMAILYTFVTTRQVGFPEDVNPRATLAFDAGAVTNRRMFHFFLDLRWLFQSELIHQRMRFEPRYLMQFLDLVKLHQGVCPNVRATGEHVEYESDAWISASMIVKEINKLCKQVALSFEPGPKYGDGNRNLERAVRTVAHVTMINAFGYERKRFHAAELKDDLAWHLIGPFELEGKQYSVPRHVVQAEPMSFHHPLHYLLSWLIECSKYMSRDEMRRLLHFAPADLKDPWNYTRGAPAPSNLTTDELLSSIFDHPLRVSVWLAQMKAGMWVRNGITLRHQAQTYRNVSHRDVGYQRDILLLQAGLVLCGNESERPGERFLAQMIDRFQMTNWVKGNFDLVAGFEQSQQLDVTEDFFHLLIIALSERGNLMPEKDPKAQHDKTLQHDIAHTLCFKPLSFSELAQRVTEKVSDSDDFNRVLESMTIFRAPEGLNDTGTFELKPEYVELVDPYYAHFSRNQREEAEIIYKKHMARKTGKKAEDVVFEPRLDPIKEGLFTQLPAFTSTPLFVQVVGAGLSFAVNVKSAASKVQVGRVETFLHMLLHLVLLAVLEDASIHAGTEGFVKLASSTACTFKSNDFIASTQTTVVSLLVEASGMDEYASCQPAIKHILRKMQLRQPEKLSTAMGPLSAILERSDNNSPAALSLEDKERKKQEALARQAKIMAQMKQQQNTFLQNQGLSGFDEEFDDLEDDMSITQESENVEQRKTWAFPTGTCILCQEETDEQRLFGSFAFMGESNILRSTPLNDADFVREVANTPATLDRSADELRPFGVSGENKRQVPKAGPNGQVTNVERRVLSKGFPHDQVCAKGPVATGCGHIMHYSCFDLYVQATQRRHTQQIARHHPERVEFREFVCPLCKALGNTFLPIIWKAKECAQEHELHAAKTFSDWLVGVDGQYTPDLSFLNGTSSHMHRQQQVQDVYSNRSFQYVANMFAPSLVQNMNQLSLQNDSPTDPHQQRYPLRRGHTLSRLFGLGYGSGTQNQVYSGTDAATPSPEQSRLTDLLGAYKRIEESIKVNQLCEPEEPDGHVNPVVALSRALGMSVSAFEISHRGVGNDPSATSLLSDMPEQALTHLRILSETIESFIAVNILKSGSNIVARETIKKRDIITAQLFGMDDTAAMQNFFEEDFCNPLFEDDIFLFFADWLSFMAPDVAEASSILQLCYWAEIVKVILVFGRRGSFANVALTAAMPSPSEQFVQVLAAVALSSSSMLNFPSTNDTINATVLRTLVDRYALTFLRKATVLMRIRYGLDFECPYNVDPQSPELERLTALLHLQPIEELCSIFNSQTPAGAQLRSITDRWHLQARKSHPDAIRLPHPAIFELVGLPQNYDTLTEEAIKHPCPTTGKEIVDPVVCLQCGDIFCSQAFCCTADRHYGGCYQHMQKHGLKTGIFINIRKCMVLFAHGPGSGSFAHAPYLDRHGEPDPTLRKHHQLFLNQRRYDRLLREVWVGHMVPSVISRKLEADINPGGWENL